MFTFYCASSVSFSLYCISPLRWPKVKTDERNVRKSRPVKNIFYYSKTRFMEIQILAFSEKALIKLQSEIVLFFISVIS